MSALLEAASLSKTFFSEHNALPAVCNVSFSVAPGECLGLAGASGCGKSTLLRLLAGLEPVSEGEIWLHDQNITTLSPRERNFAMIFQNYALFPHLSVKKNVMLAQQRCSSAARKRPRRLPSRS